MHGLRPEYQDRINFVILDYDSEEELELARELEIAAHPAFTIIPPNGAPGDHVEHIFGPLSEEQLRKLIDGALARYVNAP